VAGPVGPYEGLEEPDVGIVCDLVGGCLPAADTDAEVEDFERGVGTAGNADGRGGEVPENLAVLELVDDEEGIGIGIGIAEGAAVV